MVEIEKYTMISQNQSLDEKLIGKLRHASSLFHGINNLQKQGIFCDTVVSSGTLKRIPAHKVILLSAKSQQCNGNTGSTCSSISSDDDMDSTTSTPMEFSEVYLSEEDDAAFLPSKETPSPTETYPHQEVVESRLTAINRLRLMSQVCDVTIEVDYIKHNAHKVVLAAASNYFRCMFTDNLKEQNMDYINLNDIKDCINTKFFPQILAYIYTGEIFLTYENAFEILCLAVYFQINTLIEDCQSFLITQVCLETCCELSYISYTQDLKQLQQVTNAFIHDHFCEIRGVESHLELLEQSQFIKFLQSSTLGGNKSSTEAETQILNNVLTWMALNHAFKANELMMNVRFPLISKEFIQSHCSKYSQCNKQWNAALSYHDKIFEQPLLQTENSQLRTNILNWVCIDGVLAPSTLKLPLSSPNVTPYANCENGTGNTNTLQTIRDPFHGVIEFNGFIYVLGGTRCTSEGYSNEVIRYDPRLDKCIKVAPMNEERGDFYCCVKDDFIYVFGGRNKSGAIATCERYDPKKNAWEYISDLPDGPLYMMAGETHKEDIFISGGFNDEEAVGKILKFNCTTQTWEEIFTQMWFERGYHVLIRSQDDRLWIIGGVDNPFAGRNVWEVEVFDPATEEIQLVGQVLPIQPFLSTQRLNAFVNDDGDICIFAVTNIDKSAFIKYNIEKNLWEAIDSPINLYEIGVKLS